MQRVGKILLLVLLWTLVTVYVFYAASLARTARKAVRVSCFEVEVTDSTARGSLLNAAALRRTILHEGLVAEQRSADSIDLTAIEQRMLRNGFIATAEATLTKEGRLRVRLAQRMPVLRLLTAGMNSYVTAEGYLFTAPPHSSLYVPVVTGSYLPPVPTTYTGSLRAHIDREQWKIDTLIASLEGSKYPFYLAERQNDRRLREVRRMRTSKRWWKLESEAAFEERVAELRAIKANLRRKYRYEGRRIQGEIDRIALQQDRLRESQKKLEKKYEDFVKLLTFVDQVEQDDFWRSEVVEIIAHTAPSGALELDLVPRSGSFTIRFGRIEEVDEKLEKLLRFYDRGLAAVGWGCYREIDLRFAERVVCR